MLQNKGEIVEGDTLVWLADITGNDAPVSVRWQAEEEENGEKIWKTVATGERFSLTATAENLAKSYRVVLLDAAGILAASAPVTLPEVTPAEELIELEPIEEEIPEEASAEAADAEEPNAEEPAAEEEPVEDEAAVVETADDESAWAQLQHMIDNTQSGGTCTAEGNDTADATDGPLVIPAGKSITLQVTGTLDRNLADSSAVSDGYVIKVEEGTTLTLTGGGTVTGGNCTINGGGILNSGTLILENITISGNTSGQFGGSVYNGGTLTVNSGCTISNNRALRGGGICCSGSGSTVEMTGGVISENYAEDNGDGLGGGICVINGGSLTMTGGTVTGNTADYRGGGIYVSSGEIRMASAPVVCDNAIADHPNSMGKNLFLTGGAVVTVTGAFSDGANICVSSDREYSDECVITSGYRANNPAADPAGFFQADHGENLVLVNADGEVVLLEEDHYQKVLSSSYYDVCEGENTITDFFSADLRQGDDIKDDFTFTYYGGTLTGSAGTVDFTVGPDQAASAVITENGQFSPDDYVFNLKIFVPEDAADGEYTGKMNYWATWTDKHGDTQYYGGYVTLKLKVARYQITGLGTLTDGTITSDMGALVGAGKLVTLTVEPNECKALLSVEVKKTPGGAAVELTEEDTFIYSFTMPESNVQVTATFGGAVDYVDAKGNPLTLTGPYKLITTSLTSDLSTPWTTGWYVLKDSANFYGTSNSKVIYVDGAINIILCDGKELKATNIVMEGGSSLTIWGQSGQSGKLTITSDYNQVPSYPGIGSPLSFSGNYSITFNGGVTTVTQAHSNPAPIGGAYAGQAGSYSAGGNITINGGTVKASYSGDYGYAPALGGSNGRLTITGGTVIAKGRSECDLGGIGTTVTISGGEIDATSKGIQGSTINLSYEEGADADDISISAKSFSGTVKMASPFMDNNNIKYYAAGEYAGSALGTTVKLVPLDFSWTALKLMLLNAANGDTIVVPASVKATAADTALEVEAGKTVTLDLNGCTIDRGLTDPTALGYVLLNEGTLTITDSAGGGVITGGYNTTEGGAIVNKGTLTVTGGEISGNKTQTNGGGIWTDGTLNLEGGTVTGNQVGSGYYGGGIYFTGSDSVMNLKGAPVVTGNTPNNVYFKNDRPAVATGAFEEGMQLGLISETEPFVQVPSVTVITGATGDTSGLASDRPNSLVVVTDDGDVKLCLAVAVTFEPGDDSATGSIEGAILPAGTEYTLPGCDYELVGSDFKEWSVKIGEDEPFTKDAGESFTVTDDTVVTAVWKEQPAATANGASGSFNDRIKLNFYFDFPAEVLADTGACVTLTNESTGRSVTLPVAGAELVPDKGYKFSIPLPAKEAGDTVTAKVLDGQGEAIRLLGKTSGTDYTETGVPYTLMQYFTWLESDGTENEQAIGKAAKDYCSAAMIYFNYNADGVTVSDAVTLTELEDYTAGRAGTLPAGVSIHGITAMLESDNTLRLQLKFKGVNPADLTFRIDGKEVDLKQRADGVYYLAMDTGVWANHMQDAHSYTISDGTNTFTATASVLTYAKACAASDGEVNSDLGKALYRYCMAVTAVFPNN